MSEAQAAQEGAQDKGAAAASAAQGQQQDGQQANSGAANGAVQQDKGTIAQGAAEKTNGAVEKPYWPEDWRQKLAEHVGAGDEKAVKRELKRLERISDPTGIYGIYRDLESKFTGGNLIKKPGKDAKPEEVSEFQKALGWPEKAEELIGQIKLDNDATIGDADKPMLTNFLQAVHGATSAQEFANRAANWYFGNQEKQAAALDEADDAFRKEANAALKEEFGPSFKRRVNAIGTLFTRAPGGVDVKNEGSLYARLMGGRTADGKLIGNDPDMVRWLVSMVHEVNPAATVVEDASQGGQSIDTEIAAIEKRMREDRQGYNKDYAQQQRYLDLLGAREKNRARQRA